MQRLCRRSLVVAIHLSLSPLLLALPRKASAPPLGEVEAAHDNQAADHRGLRHHLPQ